MKAIFPSSGFANGSIWILTILLLIYSIPSLATEAIDMPVFLSQSSVSVTTNSNNQGVQTTAVSIDRADLSQPHILRVQGSINNSPIQMKQVDVKINGQLVKSIANNSLELNLAPLMQTGTYEIEISATSPRSEDTILVSLNSPNTNVTQQSSGSGSIKQKLIIKLIEN
jgi:hypothetical protein